MPKIIKDKGISQRRVVVDWNTRFNQLVLFKEENGHCRVPRKHPQLGIWVMTQRAVYNNKRMDTTFSSDQIKLLNGIGFEWVVSKVVSWGEWFEELKQYKQVNGNCNVPRNECNKQLGSWVNRQRIANKKNKLSPEQKERLEGIGFELECRKQVGWDERFEQLKGYKKDHGDCNVPWKYKANPQLATWVLKQRQLRKKGKLLKERIESLQGIGFKWVQQPKNKAGLEKAMKKKSEAVDIQWDDSNNAPTKKFVSMEKSAEETELKRVVLRLIIPAGGMGLILSTTYNGVSVMGVEKSILRHAIPSYLLGRQYCITSIRSLGNQQQFNSSIENRLDIINGIKSCRAMRLDNIEVVFQEQSDKTHSI